jgi:hypothetical protein
MASDILPVTSLPWDFPTLNLLDDTWQAPSCGHEPCDACSSLAEATPPKASSTQSWAPIRLPPLNLMQNPCHQGSELEKHCIEPHHKDASYSLAPRAMLPFFHQTFISPNMGISFSSSPNPELRSNAPC